MKIVFTKADNFGSFLIRWGIAKEPFGLAETSHVAIAFEDLVLHSTFQSGVSLISYEDLQHKYQIVAEYETKNIFPRDVEESLFANLSKQTIGAPYDISAIFYFAYTAIKRKFKQDKSWPKTNKLNAADMLFCTEVIYQLKKLHWGLGNKIILPALEDFSMVDPQTLMDSCDLDDQMERVL